MHICKYLHLKFYYIKIINPKKSIYGMHNIYIYLLATLERKWMPKIDTYCLITNANIWLRILVNDDIVNAC